MRVKGVFVDPTDVEARGYGRFLAAIEAAASREAVADRLEGRRELGRGLDQAVEIPGQAREARHGGSLAEGGRGVTGKGGESFP